MDDSRDTQYVSSGVFARIKALETNLSDVTDKVDELNENINDLLERVSEMQAVVQRVHDGAQNVERIGAEVEGRMHEIQGFRLAMNERAEVVMNTMKSIQDRFFEYHNAITAQQMAVQRLQISYNDVARIINRFWNFFFL